MSVPAKLNGCKVLEAELRERRDGNYVVLVEGWNQHTPFVTAIWHPSCGREWLYGNYFRDEKTARDDFERRVKS